MSKDFQSWSDYQRELEDENRPRTPFLEGHVWRCAIGLNTGVEMDGKSRRFWRPVIIVRKFYDEYFIAVPLTSSSKNRDYHIPVTVKGKKGYAVVDQIRMMDARRLQQYMARLEPAEFETVRDAVLNLFKEL